MKFAFPAIFFGMAAHAAIVSVLMEMGALQVSAEQQLKAAAVYLFMTLILTIIVLLAERRQ